LCVGDIVAKTLREKIVAVIVMLIGASVFGYFMVRLTRAVFAYMALHESTAMYLTSGSLNVCWVLSDTIKFVHLFKASSTSGSD
jgi:hypothetical protein